MTNNTVPIIQLTEDAFGFLVSFILLLDYLLHYNHQVASINAEIALLASNSIKQICKPHSSFPFSHFHISLRALFTSITRLLCGAVLSLPNIPNVKSRMDASRTTKNIPHRKIQTKKSTQIPIKRKQL